MISKSIADQRLVTNMSEFNQSAVVHSSVVASCCAPSSPSQPVSVAFLCRRFCFGCVGELRVDCVGLAYPAGVGRRNRRRVADVSLLVSPTFWLQRFVVIVHVTVQ